MAPLESDLSQAFDHWAIDLRKGVAAARWTAMDL
jgi:hypothetical protein